VPSQKCRLEQEAPAEALIPLDIGHVRFGSVQVVIEDVANRQWSAERRTTWGESRDES
jgi:hypothetical protein